MFGIKNRDSCRSVFKERKLLTVINLFIFKSVKILLQNKTLFESNAKTHDYNTRTKSDFLLDKTHLYKEMLILVH